MGKNDKKNPQIRFLEQFICNSFKKCKKTPKQRKWVKRGLLCGKIYIIFINKFCHTLCCLQILFINVLHKMYLTLMTIVFSLNTWSYVKNTLNVNLDFAFMIVTNINANTRHPFEC